VAGLYARLMLAAMNRANAPSRLLGV